MFFLVNTNTSSSVAKNALTNSSPSFSAVAIIPLDFLVLVNSSSAVRLINPSFVINTTYFASVSL